MLALSFQGILRATGGKTMAHLHTMIGMRCMMWANAVLITFVD